jgi:hypothetical protein
MQGKSNSFRQVTPFYPRMGMLADYVAFPVDNTGEGTEGNQAQPFGCLRVQPLEDLNASHDSGDPIVPDSAIYTLTNIGGLPIDWTLTLSETWVEGSVTSGTLNPGQSVNVVVSFNAEADNLPSSEDPYTATISFENTTNDCGSVDLGVSLEVVGEIFEQYDGPFVFPAKAFFGGGAYYSIQIVNGENRVFFDTLYHLITSSHENGDIPVFQTDPSYPKGVFRSDWNGSVFYDINTDSYVGSISALLQESGALPAGYITGAGPDRTVTRDTFDDLASDLSGGGEGRYFFSSEKYTEFGTQEGTFIRRFFSPPGGNAGNFISGVMGYIWVDGYDLVVEYSGQITVETLGHTVDTTGVPARTQHILTYDPNTNTYTGNKSRAKKTIQIPPGKTTLIGDFKFLVTPDDLSEPYFLYVTREYSVTPETNYEAIIEFPWVVGATVFYFSGTFSYSPSYYQGFTPPAILGDNGYESNIIPADSAWPKDILFANPPKNSGGYDEFDDFGDVDGNVNTLNTGYGFSNSDTFITRDPVLGYDEFEFYPDGTVFTEFGGVGFKTPGSFILRVIRFGYDEFESYPDGAITTEDGGSGDWSGDGEFIP